MWFDAQAALEHLDGAEMPRSNSAPPAEPEPPRVANVAGVAGVRAEIPKRRPAQNRQRQPFPTAHPQGEGRSPIPGAWCRWRLGAT